MTDQQIKEAESEHLPPILCHQQVIKHLRDRGFDDTQTANLYAGRRLLPSRGNGKLETALWFFRSMRSSPSLFSSGHTMASLNSTGKQPVVSDLLINKAIKGESVAIPAVAETGEDHQRVFQLRGDLRRGVDVQ